MQPNIIYVDVNATFTDLGQLIPLTFIYKKEWKIEEIIETSVLSDDEYKKLFPSNVQPNRVYRYKVRVAGVIRHIYFELWPESGAMSIGRWFVNK